MSKTTQNNLFRIRINHWIKSPSVRVIAEDGTNMGVMNTRDALKLAREQELDLVEINPRSNPPVVKIISFGRFKYDQKKAEQEAKKNQKIQTLKELYFKPNTESHDLNHKLDQAKEFLNHGDKVKFTVKFKGRELSHPEIGRQKLEWILEQLKDLIQSNTQIMSEGKTMSMLLLPVKK